MRNRYLTKRGNSYLFQLRPPKSLDPDFRLAPIRVTLGPISTRAARRWANVLAGQAHILIAQAKKRTRSMSEAIATKAEIERTLRMVGPLLRGLDATDKAGSQHEAMQRLMIETGLNGLADLGADIVNGGALAANTGRAMEDHFIRVIQDETVAGAHLGLIPYNSKIEIITKKVEEIAEAVKPKTGPRFSEAVEGRILRVKKSKGDDHQEPKTIRHHADIFLQLMEDKPVGLYTEDDIQDFVNEVQHLGPNYADDETYTLENIKAYIAANKHNNRPRFAENTIKHNYLARILGVIKHGCREAGIYYPLRNITIILPAEVPKPRNQVPPDYRTLNNIFRKGVAIGTLCDGLLPILGFLTGRRVGILTFVQAEQIIKYHNCYIVAPRDLIVRNGAQVVVPVKTAESTNFYVLHNKLVELGIVDWLLQQQGFIFRHLIGTKDPADAASKRMGRLFKGEAAVALLQTFHAFRHGRKNEDRDNKVNSEATRKQIGHAPDSVHDGYGQGVLTRAEIEEIANAPLPSEIDWSIFKGIDWDEFARHDRWPRYFAKRWEEAKKHEGK